MLGLFSRFRLAPRPTPHRRLFTLATSSWVAGTVLAVAPALAGPVAATDGEPDAAWVFLGPEGGSVRTFAVGFREEPVLHLALTSGEIYNGFAGGVLTPGRQGLPDDVEALSLAVDPVQPSILYAALDRIGEPVYKSYDGGATWEPRGAGLPDLLSVDVVTVDPRHPRVVFAGTSEGVYRSGDGGRTWQLRSRGLPSTLPGPRLPPLHTLAIDPHEPRRIYAAGNEGLYRSVNGGVRWSVDRAASLLTDSSPVLAIDPTSPETLWLGSARGVFRSTDGGRSWSEAGDGLVGELRALAVAAAESGRTAAAVWVATTAGLFLRPAGEELWAPVAGQGLVGNLAALVADPDDPDRLWAGTDLGAFETRDRGRTWIPVHRGVRAIEIGSFAFGPGSPPALFAGSPRHGVFRRTAEGGWERVRLDDAGLDGGGLDRIGPAGPVTAAPSDPSRLYAAGFSASPSVAHSLDGGETWVSEEVTEDCVAVDALAVDPVTPTAVFALVRPIGGACFHGCRLYRSGDGGKSWGCLPVAARQALAIDPQELSTMWTGVFGLPEEGPSVYRSLDRGDSWHRVLSVGREARVEALASAAGVLAVGTSDGRVLRSSDGGSGWIETSDGLPPAAVTALAIDPADPNRLFAGLEGGGIYRSTDGGQTWSRQSRGLPARITIQRLVFHPTEPALYAGTSAGVYRSGL